MIMIMIMIIIIKMTKGEHCLDNARVSNDFIDINILTSSLAHALRWFRAIALTRNIIFVAQPPPDPAITVSVNVCMHTQVEIGVCCRCVSDNGPHTMRRIPQEAVLSLPTPILFLSCLQHLVCVFLAPFAIHNILQFLLPHCIQTLLVFQTPAHAFSSFIFIYIYSWGGVATTICL